MKNPVENLIENETLKRISKEKATLWKLFMLFLCLYVLTAIVIENILPLSPDMIELLMDIDNFVCLVFLADFCFKFFSAENKLKYMKWGWIDLLSAVPFFQFLRFGRLVMIFNIIRLFRGIRSVKTIIEFVFANRAKGTFAAVGMITFIMIVFSSSLVLSVEKNVPDSNIKDPESALWWAVTTVTTVGYGDRYPVTTLGRVVAAGLMITGVALFGTFTACVSSMFFRPDFEMEETIELQTLKELRELRSEIESIKESLSENIKGNKS